MELDESCFKPLDLFTCFA